MQHIFIDQEFFILNHFNENIQLHIVQKSTFVLLINDICSQVLTISIQVSCSENVEFIFIIQRNQSIVINITVDLLKPQAAFNCIGVYITGDMKLTVNFMQNHVALESKGLFTLLGVAYDGSNIDFQGNIVMEPTSCASIGSMVHKTLVCAQSALIKTVPNLEIKTNNVRCTHATAIWQLDQEALFYIKSRGIKDEQAQKLVINGFFQESVKHINSQLGKNFFTNVFLNDLSNFINSFVK